MFYFTNFVHACTLSSWQCFLPYLPCLILNHVFSTLSCFTMYMHHVCLLFECFYHVFTIFLHLHVTYHVYQVCYVFTCFPFFCMFAIFYYVCQNKVCYLILSCDLIIVVGVLRISSTCSLSLHLSVINSLTL